MDNKLRSLIEAATEKTATGVVSWVAFDDESFRAPIGTGFLHIQRGTTRVDNGDGDSIPALTHSVQVSDSQGHVFTEVESIEGDPDFIVLAKLFAAARKAAFSGDHVLDVMLGVLRGK